MRTLAILLLTTVSALAQQSHAPSIEDLTRLNGSIDPLIQQRDSGLNALALCQGDLRAAQMKLKTAEDAMKDKSKDDPTK